MTVSESLLPLHIYDKKPEPSIVNSLYWLSFMLEPMISQASSILCACTSVIVAVPATKINVKSIFLIMLILLFYCLCSLIFIEPVAMFS